MKWINTKIIFIGLLLSLASFNSSSQEPEYQSMSITDLKLDLSELVGQKVEVEAELMSVSGMIMLTDNTQPFDTNPITGASDNLPRDDRRYILEHCDMGCTVRIRGAVVKTMLGEEIELHELVR